MQRQQAAGEKNGMARQGGAEAVAPVHEDEALKWFLRLNAEGGPARYFEPLHPLETPGLISVIVPVYNGERFLKECITSVWEQDPCGCDVEIFVVDDGSKDGSLALAEKLATASPVAMHVLRHPGGANRGVSASRNLGLASARGEWVCMLDADDAWEKGKLRTQLNYLRAHPEVRVLCSFGHNIDENGVVCKGWTGGTIAGDYSKVPPPHDFRPPYSFEQMLRGCPVVVSSVIARRGLLNEIGGFKEGLSQQCEDWILWTQAAAIAPIEAIEAPLVRYRIHPESWTTRYCNEDLEATVRFEFFISLLYWMATHPDPAIRGRVPYVYKHHFPFFIRPVAQFFKELERTLSPDHAEVPEMWLGLSHIRASMEREVLSLRRQIREQQEVIKRQERRLNLIRRLPGFGLVRAVGRAVWNRLK